MPTMAEVLEGRAHQAEMRAHTPTPGENARLAVTNLLSPILGAPAAERVGSVVENVLDFGPVPAKMATELVQQPVRAGEAVGEALADPSLPNVANAGLQTALTFGPSATLGAAGRALGAIPKSVTMSGALLGLPFATSSTAGEGSENPLHGLMTDRNRLSQQLQDAIARRDQWRPKNRQPTPQKDPKFTAADNEVKNIEARIGALDQMISDIRRENSPERQLEIQKMQEQAAREEQERRAQTPTRELFSELTPFLPVASGALGLTMGALLKGRSTKAFNDTLKSLNERWDNAVKRGHQAAARGDRRTAQRFSDEANLLRQEFEAARAAGPGGNIAPTVAGAGTGVAAAFLPEEIDLARAAPGSELQKKLYESLFSDPVQTLERAGMGALFGAFPAEVGGMTTRALMSRARPTGFAPETVSLSNMLKRSGRPQRQRSLAPQATPPALPPGGATSAPRQAATQGTKSTNVPSQTSEPIQTPWGLRDPATGRFTKKN